MQTGDTLAHDTITSLQHPHVASIALEEHDDVDIRPFAHWLPDGKALYAIVRQVEADLWLADLNVESTD